MLPTQKQFIADIKRFVRFHVNVHQSTVSVGELSILECYVIN